MRITESCAECLYNKQQYLSSDETYLSEIRRIIDNRGEDDTSPYLVYLFRKVYEKHFGQRSSYRDIKKKYNLEEAEETQIASFLPVQISADFV